MKAETTLFKLRFETDDTGEKEQFLGSRDFDWVLVRIWPYRIRNVLLMRQ